MPGKLKNVIDYCCRRCVEGTKAHPEVLEVMSLGSDGKLECVDEFHYLGDMIGAGGRAEEASRE